MLQGWIVKSPPNRSWMFQQERRYNIETVTPNSQYLLGINIITLHQLCVSFGRIIGVFKDQSNI